MSHRNAKSRTCSFIVGYISPCGGESYSKKILIHAETASKLAFVPIKTQKSIVLGLQSKNY